MLGSTLSLAGEYTILGEPEEVRTATDTYRREMDSLAAFLEELCVLHEEAQVRQRRSTVPSGIGARPLAGEHEKSQTRFGSMPGILAL